MSDSASFIIHLINVQTPAPTITQNGNDLVSSATTGNQWYNGSTIIPGANGQTYTPTTTGYYSVIITENGCVSDTSNVIYVLITEIENTFYENYYFEIFPNPANDKINVILPEKSEIEISTIQGNLILFLNAEKNHETIDVSYFAKGMYFVKVTNDKGVGVKKFIKE